MTAAYLASTAEVVHEPLVADGWSRKPRRFWIASGSGRGSRYVRIKSQTACAAGFFPRRALSSFSRSSAQLPSSCSE